eukprot:CAMPEP_0195292084 /NCGR_PEP_ID=MMETSP0707-20130614/8603_1 /TAXON_ID=33640 /ORGANISM="Asterionellopsis glacialis, Strain CCMP134" /LENGTH=474 /DNA_ID=CAMNT_0040352473 /DNA_START=59 /DNA_END=1483 /DNA_ORIENTATION=-
MEAGGEQSQDVKDSDKNETKSSTKPAVAGAVETVVEEQKSSAVEAIPTESQKRQWLSWECFKSCPIMNPCPPFGRPTPAPVSEQERAIMDRESQALFPVGFYEMTSQKRGVTRGRGQWRGKEVLRLSHCTAERAGCKFKVRFCRVFNGIEVFTSGEHNVSTHSAKPKRGLPPDIRAFVSRHHDESQKHLLDALKEGGLLDPETTDWEKVRQQVKRRKMTVRRKVVKKLSEDEVEREQAEEQQKEFHIRRLTPERSAAMAHAQHAHAASYPMDPRDHPFHPGMAALPPGAGPLDAGPWPPGFLQRHMPGRTSRSMFERRLPPEMVGFGGPGAGGAMNPAAVSSMVDGPPPGYMGPGSAAAAAALSREGLDMASPYDNPRSWMYDGGASGRMGNSPRAMPTPYPATSMMSDPRSTAMAGMAHGVSPSFRERDSGADEQFGVSAQGPFPPHMRRRNRDPNFEDYFGSMHDSFSPYGY